MGHGQFSFEGMPRPTLSAILIENMESVFHALYLFAFVRIDPKPARVTTPAHCFGVNVHKLDWLSCRYRLRFWVWLYNRKLRFGIVWAFCVGP